VKIYKCPNCKDVRTVEDDVVTIQCACGYHKEEVDKIHKVK